MFGHMFVSSTPMHQDRRVKVHHPSGLARPFSALALSLLLLLFATAGPVSAEAPSEVTSPITDNAKALGTDQAIVDAALKELTRKAGLHLYVVYVKSFDGLTGTDWAEKTAAQSAIGSADILLAVSTSDSHYGVAEPSESAISDKEFNAIAANTIRPAVNSGDWSGVAIDAAQGYEKASDDSGLPWTLLVTGALAIALAAALAVHRNRRRYDETHVIHDQDGQPVNPLDLMDLDELINQAQLSVADVEDPELKTQLGRQLSDLLATNLRRTDDIRRTLAIDIIHRSLDLGSTKTAGADSADNESADNATS